MRHPSVLIGLWLWKLPSQQGAIRLACECAVKKRAVREVDQQMALIAFINAVLASFLSGLVFLIFGTLSYVLLADIFFPEKMKVLREKLDDEQIRKISLGVLAVNIIFFAGKMLLTD